MWLANAGRYPIPTFAQQLIFGKAISRGQQPDATVREQRQGKRALDRLVQGNLRLVVPLARKYTRAIQGSGCSLEFIDLLQIGAVGLIRGAEKFDFTRGFRFSTYAYWWIQQGITREISANRGAFKIPTALQELNLRWCKRPEGQSVSEFIAAWPQCRYTPEGIRDAQLAVASLASTRSLDMLLQPNESDGVSLIDQLACDKDEAAEVLQQIDLEAAFACVGGSDDLALIELQLEGANNASLAHLLDMKRSTAGHELKKVRKRLQEQLHDARELIAA